MRAIFSGLIFEGGLHSGFYGISFCDVSLIGILFPVSSCIPLCSVTICLHGVLFCYIVSEWNFVLVHFVSLTFFTLTFCFCDVLSCEIFSG